MDRLTAMRSFVKVVEEGGFAAAGRALGVSRAAVNRQVLSLEEALGVQLFNRSTRRVVPTESGNAYYERASAILAELDEAERAVTSLTEEPRGTIHVNAPMSFGTLHLGAAVAGFMRRYPEIRVQLTLNDRFVDPFEEGFDVTIRIARLADSDLVARRLAPARLVACAAPAYLKRHGEPRNPGDLRRHACLHYGHMASRTFWRLQGPRGAERVPVAAQLCSNNGEVLREAALQGLGIALLPTFIVGAELQAGTLRTVLAGYAVPELSIYAIYPPNRYLSAKVRLFIDHLAGSFGARPYWDLVE